MLETKPTDSNPLLKVEGIVMTFGTIMAVNNVSFALQKGEVLGLIGENGSGKSTITSVIAGMQKPKSGKMQFKGKKWEPLSMIDALHNGVGMVVQESGTIPGITVAENIFLGETDRFCTKFGFLNKAKMNQEADDVMAQIGAKDVRGSMLTANLDFQTRKLIEIAKVIMKKPDVLIIDETTTALSQNGRKILYNIISAYKKANKAVIFISHDMDEILNVCTSLLVLRDGKYIRTFKKAEFDEDEIRTSMIGRELKGDYYRSDFTASRSQELALSLKNVSYKDRIQDVSIDVYKGEILGIGGLSHCGMHSLGKVMFGALKPDCGSVTRGNGNPVKDEASAMAQNIGYVSKDRDVESLVLQASVKDNIAIAGMNKYALGNFLILDNRENAYVDEQIKTLSIKCSSRNQLTSQLSGGNKQKVVFGKWVGRGSEVLILDCPTRGVDIGVKQAMYQLMMKLKAEGKSIIMISEEMPELIGMSDRLLIMKDGKVMKEFARSQSLSDADTIKYMI